MFNPTKGPAREELSQQDLAQLRQSGTIVDSRRTRPAYFDGRFLAARDLTREQSYFLTRQADLGRALGAGVVHGLQVEPGPTATTLQIAAGHGVTPSGESVVIAAPLVIDLADVSEMQRLDAAFQLSKRPRPAARNRTGLFTVVLRPVEFTANPIASYPTSITGPRSVQDGDIIEAAAISLVPYAADVSSIGPSHRRARVARDTFVARARSLPPDVLPLAVIFLTGSLVEWVDPFLVRREVGADHGDVLGLGFAPRGQREAYAIQYEHHLRDVLVERARTNRPARFAATEHFLSVPAGGHMPTACINETDFTQTYFPAEVDVDLSIVPDDEVPALIEESLLLPPVDLTASVEELESTNVLVLVPVPRVELRPLRAQLGTLRRDLRPAAPGLLARRRPLEVLRNIRLPNPGPIVRDSAALVDGVWRQVLSRSPLVWYVRRRNLAYRADVTGTRVVLSGQDVDRERALDARLGEAGLRSTVSRLRSRASAPAAAEMVSLLSSQKFERSPALMQAAVHELDAQEQLDHATVLKVAERFSAPGVGEGLMRLEEAHPALKTNKTLVKRLVDSGTITDIDRLGRVTAADDIPGLARAIESAAKRRQPKQLRELTGVRLKGAKP